MHDSGFSHNVNVSETISEIERRRVPRALHIDEWLRQRSPFVGASAVAALFGEHPYLTLGQLAEQKRTSASADDNEAMQRGRFLEAPVADWWAEVHGVEVTEVRELYVANDCVMATLDRLITERPTECLEVKTTTATVTDEHDAPRYWWWQAQAQLACTGFERVQFAVLDGALRLRSFAIAPDAEAIAALLDGARLFLDAVNDNRVDEAATFTPPEAVELPERVHTLVHVARLVKQRMDRDNAEFRRMRAMVSAAMGACKVGAVDGVPMVHKHTVKGSRRIDGAALRADHPDIAEQYTKVGAPSERVVFS